MRRTIKKEPITPHAEYIGRVATSPKTKFVKLDDRPLKELLFYITDDTFVEARVSRTGARRFSAHIIMNKKGRG